MTFVHHFCKRLSSVRLRYLLLPLLLVTVAVPLIVHYVLTKEVESTSSASMLYQSKYARRSLGAEKSVELKERINELMAIKSSVSDELRSMESKRMNLQAEITDYVQRVESLKQQVMLQQRKLDRLNLAVEQAKYAEKDALNLQTPNIKAPMRILPKIEDNINLESVKVKEKCRMNLCFDHSRCSVTSLFPVYLYTLDELNFSASRSYNILRTVITESLQKNVHLTYNPEIACVYVVIVSANYSSVSEFEHNLQKLSYWNGDGRNHVLLNLNLQLDESDDTLSNANTGRAIIVQSTFTVDSFRQNFDFVTPSLVHSDSPHWRSLPSHSPARRKYLLSFQGQYHQGNSADDMKGFMKHYDLVIQSLRSLGDSAKGDEFKLVFTCQHLSESPSLSSDWDLCDDSLGRTNLLSQSTYSLLILPANQSLVSTGHIIVRLMESIKYGAIPVILGGDRIVLPLQEVIDWNLCVIMLPLARVTELHFIIKSFSDADILSMRRQGHYVWQTYFSNPERMLNSLLSCLRTRLRIPPPAVDDHPSPSVFYKANHSLHMLSYVDVDSPEILGPLEIPFPSEKFQRNISQLLLNSNDLWNVYFDPFHLYQSLPFDPILPSEAKFVGSSKGFRPINQGEGGSGKEFSQAIGGNSPSEQFTIVVLTYEREAVLIEYLEKFYGLPNLNKIVVVSNSPKPPSESLNWPDLTVPIHVIKPKKNSLNNRFLPYEAIETDAVLSIDDDAHLRHDEITFGFRVWRENRDRIVGFPGRFHSWDVQTNNGWLYNSNYSCELSMVLTGAAFLHKYYLYQYSNMMPKVIRDKVDEYMNCEDLAMNFLVSHMTRKPPIKITSRWTFRCPGCPGALFLEDSHFIERHKCLNFFAQVYGYVPLLYTQFRADSVLFKTRLPQDKQKCFKYI